MRFTKKVKILSIIAMVFVLFNGYLLLKDNEIISKKYYINNVQFAVADDYEKVLEKNAVVTSKYEHFIAAPVQSISEVLVTQGQTISALSELAIYKPEQAEREMTRLQTDHDAYSSELAELESIVSNLQDENSNSTASTATDSTTLGDNENWNVNLTLELGIEQNTPTAEGIAIIQRSIAETQRQLDILDNMITQLSNNNSLASPVDGVVKDIVLEGDSIIFQIQSIEKKVVVYVTHKDWEEVKIGNRATITLHEELNEQLVVEGSVLEKQQIPAQDSIAYSEMKKHEKVSPNETVYEVSIEPIDLLLETPIGTLANAKIITVESDNSFEVRENWLVQYEQDEAIPSVNEKLIYIVNEDGKTALEPVDVLFTHKAKIKQNEYMYAAPVPDETQIEEEVDIPAAPRIQTVELQKPKEENTTKKDHLEDVAVFTAPINPYQIFLDGDEKNLLAPTFRPYPLRTFELESLDVTWRDVVWYLVK